MVLGSNDVTYLSDGSPNTFRVAFQEPIPLTPHVNYLACATIKVSASSSLHQCGWDIYSRTVGSLFLPRVRTPTMARAGDER